MTQRRNTPRRRAAPSRASSTASYGGGPRRLVAPPGAAALGLAMCLAMCLVLCLASACDDDTTSPGATGQHAGGKGGGSASTGSGSGAGGGGPVGGAAPGCWTCFELLTTGGDSSLLCQDQGSVKAFADLKACFCGSACVSACGGNFCSQLGASSMCQACTPCSAELSACLSASVD